MPILIGIILLLFLSSFSFAKDNEAWETNSEEVRKWYRELMQPDNYNVSCCGEADAYWADLFEATPDGNYIAIITEEERKIVPQGRPIIPSGTKIVVPKHKLKYDKGNPTGHGIIFVSGILDVYCYVVPGGV